MIEISVITLSLLIEFIFILLIGIISWIYFLSRKKKKDRQAALTLVDQIKHQSDTRRKTTGAYLQEKYHLEGRELHKAIESIDKSEKRFYQKVIDLYLRRDAEALTSVDADLAELIDTYKSLKPVVKLEADEVLKDAKVEQLEAENEQLAVEKQQLEAEKEQLIQELEITKKTMGDMVGEFGNMFGGGKDNELEQEDVVEKVISGHHDGQEAVQEQSTPADEIDIQTEEVEDSQNETGESEEVSSDADIDDILNGITVPGEEKK